MTPTIKPGLTMPGLRPSDAAVMHAGLMTRRFRIPMATRAGRRSKAVSRLSRSLTQAMSAARLIARSA